MKLNSDQVQNLAARLESSRRSRALGQEEIAKSLGISQGQVSRACSGDFASLNETIMRICIYLEVVPPEWSFPVDSDEYRLTAGILSIWNRTPEDAERLLGLLRSVSEIRKSAAAAIRKKKQAP